MTCLKNSLLSNLLTTISLCVFCSLTLAQDTSTSETNGNEGRWFQVEVIVFTQEESQYRQETWPTNISLAYPPNWKRLKSVEEKYKDPERLLASSPFLKLPIEMRVLNNNFNDLEKSAKHRVLFHEAWRQQVWGVDEAPSLLISGGQQFGEHYELEGSINLSVARYLHLRTNLWFTEFQHNFGQQKHDYPELPIAPDNRSGEAKNDFPINNQSPWDNVKALNGEYEKILETPYINARIITMKDKRKMRSKEIHYIDNPVLGIIIYILPYDLPEQEIEQEDEEEITSAPTTQAN